MTGKQESQWVWDKGIKHPPPSDYLDWKKGGLGWGIAENKTCNYGYDISSVLTVNRNRNWMFCFFQSEIFMPSSKSLSSQYMHSSVHNSPRPNPSAIMDFSSDPSACSYHSPVHTPWQALYMYELVDTKETTPPHTHTQPHGPCLKELKT